MTTPDSDSGPPTAPSILVADDHDLVRIGMLQLLRHWNPGVVVGEAANGPALERLLTPPARWNLLLLDLTMPGFGGEPAVRALLSRHPELPVLLVSGTSDAATTARLLDAGVAGFLPKSLDGGLMVKAIELVLAGGRYVPPDVLRGLPAVEILPAAGVPQAREGGDITPRQREILALLLQGLPNKVIAARLDIAEATVKMHVTALLRAHDVSSRAELLARLR